MRATLVATSLVVLTACTGVTGRFHGEGGPAPDWTLRPNRCDADPYAGSLLTTLGAVDMYYRGSGAADTEVVVKGQALQPQVLVRIPGQSKMVVLRKSDCTVFEVYVHGAGFEINDDEPSSGRVRIDCNRPEIGHVTGEASFVCL
jgi:hypothetical protein